MEKKSLTHTIEQLDYAISMYDAAYTLPEQVVFTVSLDPTEPKVHLIWLWPSTDFASGIMIRKKANAIPESSHDGVEVCNIEGTSVTTYDDTSFDIEDPSEVGTTVHPVKWYYRAFPYNTIGQRQAHYQTTVNRGVCAVNVYYIPDSTTLSYMEVGGIFRFGHYGSTYLTWKIVDKSEDRLKVIMNTPMASADLGNVQFDAPEPNNPNSSRKSYGNNRWSVSNDRQWLNSDGEAGAWFTPQTDYDVCTTGLVNKNGFLHDFTAAERAIIIPEQNVCVLSSTDGGGSETVFDLVWLPSRTEVGLGNESASVPEGSVFEYFSGDGNTDARRAEGYNRNYWLRTAYSDNAFYVRFVAAAGGRSSNHAFYSYAVRAGLTLPLSTPIIWNDEDAIAEAQVL